MIQIDNCSGDEMEFDCSIAASLFCSVEGLLRQSSRVLDFLDSLSNVWVTCVRSYASLVALGTAASRHLKTRVPNLHQKQMNIFSLGGMTPRSLSGSESCKIKKPHPATVEAAVPPWRRHFQMPPPPRSGLCFLVCFLKWSQQEVFGFGFTVCVFKKWSHLLFCGVVCSES